MGRAISFSLIAHAAFALSFLLLSATRQPLPVSPAARPVRLVTYLEPAAAPRSRPAAVAAAATRPAPSLPAARVAVAPRPAPATAVSPAVSSPAAVAVPRFVIPAPAPAPASLPAPAAEAPRPGLGERLARRLASAAPAGTPPTEATAPTIASLPRLAPAADPPAGPVPHAIGAPDGPAAPAAPGGAVEPVGYFPHSWYLALLKEEIYARWSPPSEFFQNRRPPAALVSFRITRAGKLEAVALKEGSGSSRFDQSALAAVRGLGAVPGLPEQYAEESLNVVIRFQNLR